MASQYTAREIYKPDSPSPCHFTLILPSPPELFREKSRDKGNRPSMQQAA
ncbi:MAG: hypothetical protein ACMUIA_01055 [bacterium]